jgi:hypothetical protein
LPHCHGKSLCADRFSFFKTSHFPRHATQPLPSRCHVVVSARLARRADQAAGGLVRRAGRTKLRWRRSLVLVLNPGRRLPAWPGLNCCVLSGLQSGAPSRWAGEHGFGKRSCLLRWSNGRISFVGTPFCRAVKRLASLSSPASLAISNLTCHGAGSTPA